MVSFDISHIIKAVGGNMFISPHLLICIYNSSKVFPHASLTCFSTQNALFIVWIDTTTTTTTTTTTPIINKHVKSMRKELCSTQENQPATAK